MVHLTSLLHRTECAVSAAAQACRDWENGGDAGSLSDSAWDADGATAEATDAVAGIDPAVGRDTYPETRLGRLVLAARLLVMAGTDEGGQSGDLDMAAQLLRQSVAES